MPRFENTIWIVHREPGPRGALARMAGGVRGRHEMVLGTPWDPVFESAAAPQVIVLDVSSLALDPEPELDFARRVAARHGECAWILLAEPASLDAARQLFDSLDAQTIAYPPDARTLQGAVTTALEGQRPLPLSRRIGRDHLSARFARWFSEGDPPELALALDPRLADEPVLARGERGTGRGLLLRYMHAVSTPEAGPFVRVACAETTRSDQLLAQIEDGVREAGSYARRAGARFGLWLEDADQLAENVQARVVDWMDFGLPLGLPAAIRGGVRWLASAGSDPGTGDPRLLLAFSELTIWTVPLRDRPQRVESFVADTTRAWAAARREAAKPFDPPALVLLRGEPWPGNLAELEAVVVRSLAHASPEAETIRISDLRLEPRPAPEGIYEAPPDARAAEPPARPPAPDDRVARLAAAVAHEVRNPLVSIRTFAELLDDHYADEEFRTRFGRLVAEDVRRIEEAVDRLEQMGETPPQEATGAAESIDMTVLLEGLLDEQRPNIQSKRLLVLKELDRTTPHALGDPEVLRPALADVLAHAIDEVPDRGDLYVASRHHPGDEGGATIRILFRYRIAPATAGEPGRTRLRESTLDHVRLQNAIQSQGGTLTIDTTQTAETLIVIDLPAPASN